MYYNLKKVLRRLFGVDNTKDLADFVKKQEDILNKLFDKTGVDVDPDVFISRFCPDILLNPSLRNESDELIAERLTVKLFEYLKMVEFEPMAPFTDYCRMFLLYEHYNMMSGNILREREVKDIALRYSMGLVNMSPLDYLDIHLNSKAVKNINKGLIENGTI